MLIGREVLNRHDDDTGKSDDEDTVTSGSLSMCTCVSRTQHVAFAAQPLLCAVGLFAHSELSHTQRTGFSPCLSSPPSPLCPTMRPRSLRAPRALSSPRILRRRHRRPTSHGPSPSQQRVFPAAPEAAGWLPRSADRADCLYGWLAGWLCRRSHPAGHLPLLPRVCRHSAGVYLALPASL